MPTVNGFRAPVCTKASGPPTWTQVFGDALVALGQEHPELAAITAAMPSGTGTNVFQKAFPERFFDVGIAEGHAVTFAGGLAFRRVLSGRIWADKSG